MPKQSLAARHAARSRRDLVKRLRVRVMLRLAKAVPYSRCRIGPFVFEKNPGGVVKLVKPKPKVAK